jgi:hypothetical protein
MKLAIFGAAGRTGIPLLQQALEQGNVADFMLKQVTDTTYLRQAPFILWDGKDMAHLLLQYQRGIGRNSEGEAILPELRATLCY